VRRGDRDRKSLTGSSPLGLFHDMTTILGSPTIRPAP
jgi:hypothetical protein